MDDIYFSGKDKNKNKADFVIKYIRVGQAVADRNV